MLALAKAKLDDAEDVNAYIIYVTAEGESGHFPLNATGPIGKHLALGKTFYDQARDLHRFDIRAVRTKHKKEPKKGRFKKKGTQEKLEKLLDGGFLGELNLVQSALNGTFKEWEEGGDDEGVASDEEEGGEEEGEDGVEEEEEGEEGGRGE